jgi:hypothetical protein
MNKYGITIAIGITTLKVGGLKLAAISGQLYDFTLCVALLLLIYDYDIAMKCSISM